MAGAGKRIRAAREGIDRTAMVSLDEAVKLVKERASAKFDETIEVALNLGVDPRHADQMVRGVCQLAQRLPGRVCSRGRLSLKDDKAEEAKAAGADIVGAEDLVEKVQSRG